MSEIAQSYLFSELNSDQERASEQSLGQRNSRKQQWELAMAKELQEGVEVINAEGGQVSLINSSEFAHLATTDGSVNVAKTEAVKNEQVVSPPNQ